MNLPLDMQTCKIGDLTVVTVVVDGVPYSAGNEHPNFKEILRLATEGDTSVVDLFDVSVVVAKKFESLSERVSVHDGRVYFDGEVVDSALTRQIVAFLQAGVEDFKPLVNFFEKVEQNPNEDSRKQLYAWLDAHDFTITPEGDLLGYKGVRKTDDDKYVSVNTGRAIVNGQEVSGAIPNNIGDVVTMPRSEVEFNPSVGCSTGLHVGTWSYAKGWSQGEVLEVVVNPRDVVSVPHDCSAQKLRTCRYVVTGVATGDYATPLRESSWKENIYNDYDVEEQHGWYDGDDSDPWQ
jgi:hypothetical protein